MHKSVPLGILTGLLMGLSVTSLAASGSVEERLERIEKLLGNQVLMEQMQNMQQVRMELAEIRELVENQEHQLSMIKQRQRNLYQDMDRRLHDLEVGNGGKSSSSSGASKGYSPVQPPSAKSAVAAPVAGAATISTRAPVASDPDGKLAYGQAFNLLKEGRYQQAIIDFRGFIKIYPESKYAANAQYWLGEASYVSRDYKTALIEFQVIINQFPTSNKVQGAALKIGYTFYEMQDWASARTALNNVVIQYPDTTVARKAQERLQRMKREGH